MKIFAQGGVTVNNEDRLSLAALLVKFGYTVRVGKEKAEGSKNYQHFVEYAEQKEDI